MNRPTMTGPGRPTGRSLAGRRLAVLFLAAGVALALACSDDGPTGPTPGTLSVVLDTPNASDAAIHFAIAGSGISNVRAANTAYQVFERTAGNTANVAVVGTLTDGALVQFDVSDTRGTYTAAILDVAGASNDLLPTGAHVLTVQ